MARLKIEAKNLAKLSKELARRVEPAKKVIQATTGDMRSRVPGLVATEVREVYNIQKKEITPIPGVTFLTAEHKAMGNVELPMLAQIEAMEAAITKKGYDVQLAKLARPEASNIEIRFVQDVIDADNVSKPEGCKVFMRMVSKTLFTTYEFDHSLHLYIGMMAIIAKNPHIDIKDLERVKGYDMIKIATVGRNFILTGAGENSDQNSSGDTSETMQEPLTPALENSETAN